MEKIAKISAWFKTGLHIPVGTPLRGVRGRLGEPSLPVTRNATFLNHAKISRRRGFTLIEMLAVMAIMMVLMTIAMVGFNEWSGTAATRGAILDVKSNLVSARQWAITHRKKTSFAFGNTTAFGAQRGFFSLTNSVDGSIGNINYMPAGVLFTNIGLNVTPPDSIVFSIDGQIWRGSGADLIDTNLAIFSKGNVSTVRVYALTGRARVLR